MRWLDPAKNPKVLIAPMGAEDIWVNSFVTNNVIAFPAGGLIKKKARKWLRDIGCKMASQEGLEPPTAGLEDTWRLYLPI
jgi:hypothetical protein